jgi:hypothetical protein
MTNSQTSGDKPVLFIHSAMHAREYATAELTLRFAQYLLNNYGTNADVSYGELGIPAITSERVLFSDKLLGRVTARELPDV